MYYPLIIVILLAAIGYIVFCHNQLKSIKKIRESFPEDSSFGNRNMEDQLDLFTYSTFSVECCPSTYTTSLGCLCNDYKEHEFITSRGGNRIHPQCSS